MRRYLRHAKNPQFLGIVYIMMELMTKAQYAERRGVSRPAITKLVKNGRIIVNPDGLVDVEMSDLILDNFSRPSQGTRKPVKVPKTRAIIPRKVKRSAKEKAAFTGMMDAITGHHDYNTARSLLTSYMADLKKLELQEKQGEMLHINDVSREAFESARRTRDAILAIEDRISDILAAETDRVKIKEILNTEHRNALEELANMPVINEQIEKHKDQKPEEEEEEEVS